MSLSIATAARLLAMHQREFDNAGCSRSLSNPRSSHGAGMTIALFVVAAMIAVICLI